MRRASIASLLAAALLAAAFVALSGGSPAVAQGEVTITVDTTSNVVDFGGAQTVQDLPGADGQTSLREAALASTNTTGPETIAFGIPTSDPGFTGDEFVIRIDPASPSEELTLGDDGTTIDATTQPGGVPITVQGGEQAMANNRNGLTITSSDNTVIGLGIRGYWDGLRISFDENLIAGNDNRIIDSSMTQNRSGVVLRGAGSEITASTISDNTGSGVVVVGTTGAVVDGNTITGNGTRGVSILSSGDATVTGNLISGNGFWGIEFSSGSGTGFCPVGDRAGIAAGNTITGNAPGGIRVGCAHRFTISGNSIAGNDGLGISLSGGRTDANGVTRNDPKDGDSGANQLLNYPERLQAEDDGTATVVEGRVSFPDPQSLTLELFANEAPDPSGFGEGETFLATATPDAKGRFTATLPAGLGGQWLTATSTDSAGNTSEFSEAVQVAGPRK